MNEFDILKCNIFFYSFSIKSFFLEISHLSVSFFSQSVNGGGVEAPWHNVTDKTSRGKNVTQTKRHADKMSQTKRHTDKTGTWSLVLILPTRYKKNVGNRVFFSPTSNYSLHLFHTCHTFENEPSITSSFIHDTMHGCISKDFAQIFR